MLIAMSVFLVVLATRLQNAVIINQNLIEDATQVATWIEVTYYVNKYM